MKRLVSFGMILAAALALTGGTASATTGTATFMDTGVTGCDLSGDHGTATWDTEASQGPKVRVRATGLTPETEYSVEIVIGCNLSNAAQQVLGTLTTNKKGSAKGSFTFETSEMGGLHFRLAPVLGGPQFYTDVVDLSSP